MIGIIFKMGNQMCIRDRSYYDELGVRVSGKTEINGVTYLFDYDQLITNGVFSS